MGKALWLYAAFKVWKERIYLASRAVMGIPAEVTMGGKWRGQHLEMQGPVRLNFKGGVKEVESLTVRSGTLHSSDTISLRGPQR